MPLQNIRAEYKRTPGHQTVGGSFCIRREAPLVFDNLGDRAHGAFLDAIAARDAGILVDDLDDTADYFKNLLRARINANPAADALIGFDNRMGHSSLLLV